VGIALVAAGRRLAGARLPPPAALRGDGTDPSQFDPRLPSDQAGLCVRANEDFHLALSVGAGEGGRELTLVETAHGRSRTIGRAKLTDGPVTLALEATALEYLFFGGAGDRLDLLGRIPTKTLSAETILAASGRHHFTGATIGLFATGAGSRALAPADFHWFEYLPR
jgi:alpha-N-arabinofuranosidase